MRPPSLRLSLPSSPAHGFGPVLALALLGWLCLAGGAAGQVKRVTRPLLRPNPYRGLRFFPSLKWRVTIGMTANTVPAIADLDLDGKMDIIVPAAGGVLYRLTEDGNVVWKATLPEPIAAGVTLGDVDRSGSLAILAAAGKTLWCYGADGKERWHFDLPEPITSFPTIADLDGDGNPEIIFGANDNRLHVLDGRGREKWSFETKSWIVGGVAVSDLDGDGKLEVVFGSMDFNLYCVDAAGKERWHYATEDWVQSSPCIADLEHSGQKSVVAVSDDGNLYCLSDRGTLKWKSEVSSPARTRAYLAVGDLDGDGTRETVVALPDGNVEVFTAFGDRAWTRQVPGGVSASPILADLNGDRWQDILVVTRAGQMVALDTWGGTHWTSAIGNTIEATPIIADLNHNGKYEIYVANLMVSRRTGFFSQFELSVPGGVALWTTLKGDPYRTGDASNSLDFSRAQARGGDYATSWEPFLAGYRPKTGVVAPRKLRISALPPEDYHGNRDGALDPGESAVWKVRVTNLGAGPSYDNLLSADLRDSGLQLDRTSAYLGWIAPHATKTVTFRLAGAGPSGAHSGSGVIRLVVRESGVEAAVAEAQVRKVPPLPPVIRAVSRRLLDGVSATTYGNGNGQLDSGESVVLRLLLQNTNLTTARSATVRLTSDSADLLIATPEAVLRNVVPFGGRRVDFSIRVARELKGRGATLTLTTQATGAPAYSQRIPVSLHALPVDKTPPVIALQVPAHPISITQQARVNITGTVSDRSDVAALLFEGRPVPVSSLPRTGPNRYRFSFPCDLKVGENVFPLSATDGAGNSTTTWVRIVRKP